MTEMINNIGKRGLRHDLIKRYFINYPKQYLEMIPFGF